MVIIRVSDDLTYNDRYIVRVILYFSSLFHREFRTISIENGTVCFKNYHFGSNKAEKNHASS